jgi:hypothetical protein
MNMYTIYIWIHLSTCLWIHLYIYIYICICILYIYGYIYLHVCEYILKYKYVWIYSMQIFKYIHISTYRNRHPRTYKDSKSWTTFLEKKHQMQKKLIFQILKVHLMVCFSMYLCVSLNINVYLYMYEYMHIHVCK